MSALHLASTLVTAGALLPCAALAQSSAQSTAAPPPVGPTVQSIGSVGLEDATVAGDLIVAGGRAMLVGNSTVVAKDHTAEVHLRRGGDVRVCATSGLHLSQSRSGGPQPLLLALDSGAIEILTDGQSGDTLLTPDLRFTLRSAGTLDLRLRVTRNGDTCVENKGTAAPTLGITDQFGAATYEVHAGQHVLFEHGSLKEVVDHETSPCGCPAPTPLPSMSIADALLTAKPTPQTQAAAEHPFPAAVSEGLAPPPPIPQAAPGAPHAQVATTLGYTAEAGGTISGTPATPAATPPPPPAAPPQPGFAHRIGRFFKRLFGG